MEMKAKHDTRRGQSVEYKHKYEHMDEEAEIKGRVGRMPMC